MEKMKFYTEEEIIEILKTSAHKHGRRNYR